MLLKTIEEITAHVEINQNMSFDLLKPSIFQAELKYIIPAIGLTFYNELDAAPAPTADQLQAVQNIQRALANYAVYLYGPKGMVQTGNAGLLEHSSQNNVPTRQWVFDQLQESYHNAGDTSLDFTLAWLEINKTKFPTWAESEAYTESKELFVSNASELAEFTNVAESRRTYLAMRPFIRRAERQQLRELIGEDLFKKLKGSVLSPAEEELIADYIKPAVAVFAAYNSIPELPLEISDEGVRFKSYNTGIRRKEKAGDSEMLQLYRSLEHNGEAELASLKAFLFKNADTYPEFKSSRTWLDSQGGDSAPNTSDQNFVLV